MFDNSWMTEHGIWRQYHSTGPQAKPPLGWKQIPPLFCALWIRRVDFFVLAAKKCSPTPILRTLNTRVDFFVLDAKKCSPLSLFYAICMRRIDLFVINTKLGWLRNNSSQQSKALRYEKKLVKSLIWEQVFQNILAAIDNSFVIHIINTIYN